MKSPDWADEPLAVLWRLVEPMVWPGVPRLLAVLLVVLVAVRVAHRLLWNRAVRGGYWLTVTPPRLLDPEQAEQAWELLAGLVWRAGSGLWRLAHPPLAFEVHATGHRQTVGLWLPGWVPQPVATAAVAQAWPGARAEPATPPAITSPGHRYAGLRLAANPSAESGWLVNPELLSSRATGRAAGPATDGDVLRAVWSSLAGTDATNAVVQVLVRPAPARRIAGLGNAARYPQRPRRRASVLILDGLVWLVRLPLGVLLELLSPGPSRTRPHRPPLALDPDYESELRPDRIEVRRMRQAGDKLTARPRLLATVRIGASARDRRIARAAGRQAAEGFALASRMLHPTRLHRPASALAARRAGRRDWLLVTTAELATLAHIPTDPARYGLATAARHRPPPVTARRASAERATRRAAGWRHDTWTTPVTRAPVTGGPVTGGPVRAAAGAGVQPPQLRGDDPNGEDEYDDDWPY